MDTSTQPLTDIPVVILAGGQSRRFGMEKAFAQLDGTPLIDVLLQQLARQSAQLVAVNCDPASGLVGVGRPTCPDLIGTDQGPLAGIHAAMSWAGELGCEQVITVPVDTPILPSNFIRALNSADAPAICRHNGRVHYLHGIWPVCLKRDLAAFVDAGNRAAKHWVQHCAASECDFGPSDEIASFFNVNSPSDLRTLEGEFRNSREGVRDSLT